MPGGSSLEQGHGARVGASMTRTVLLMALLLRPSPTPRLTLFLYPRHQQEEVDQLYRGFNEA